MDDRIRLAEAMGWTNIHERQMIPERKGWYGYPHPAASRAFPLPNPFEDANDDYAVLEWMRENYHSREITEALSSFQMEIWSYGIGDYARAALKMISDE